MEATAPQTPILGKAYINRARRSIGQATFCVVYVYWQLREGAYETLPSKRRLF
jgi:hypothetical protein